VAIGKIVGWLGLVGWLWHATRRRHEAGGERAERGASGEAGAGGDAAGSMRFLELFVLLYIGLYLVWPFNFARFWSPILPVMLVYAGDAVVRFRGGGGGVGGAGEGVAPAAALLGLLLVLSAVEDGVQMGNYARRLNYVSDALARGVETIMKRSPDPGRTAVAAMNGDDHFALAWYFAQERTQGVAGRAYRVSSPLPHVEAKGGAGETVEEMMVRLVEEARGGGGGERPGAWRVYLFSYFAHADAAGVFRNLERRAPEVRGGVEVEKVMQQEIISAVWEVRPKGQGAGER
jgi:hypothetical protein